MKITGSAYEVRCPRCSVSFPVGTKTCMHCGGKTVLPGEVVAASFAAADSASPSAFDFGGDDFDYGTSHEEGSAAVPGAIEARAEPIFSPRSDAGEDSDVDGVPASSPMSSLVRSLGTFVWIALLIFFTMFRDCMGE